MIERVEELEKALKKSGGRAVVLVHPFYHEYNPEHYDGVGDPINPARNLTGKKYLEKQASLLKKTRLPLIVLEEAGTVENTRRRVGRDAFMIPTLPEEPDPVKGWKVVDALKKKGLKVALMGGQKLICGDKREMITHAHRVHIREVAFLGRNLPSAHRYETFPYDGCVQGAVYEFMRRKVRVGLLRNAVYPDAPRLRK